MTQTQPLAVRFRECVERGEVDAAVDILVSDAAETTELTVLVRP